ncbi:uncharacterized protein FOMMEDRAFT_26929 [Fomitiporia mediterranea MF3/22]|uniref:uncharacterized protein n=1 Tax=Fomitiporia mediterranea (strain MF3/22) TaxID=694068 RepID=UPI000440802E|nr:uncharacterized protein FOMMEDRAFT_26929 [Fomitiporia mediterranea MF3/22]EJD06198.1 hypothetical protein FOMMEDRAFT_26929 [Fomitiporia mediterranea MF3/22]
MAKIALLVLIWLDAIATAVGPMRVNYLRESCLMIGIKITSIETLGGNLPQFNSRVVFTNEIEAHEILFLKLHTSYHLLHASAVLSSICCFAFNQSLVSSFI